MSTWGRSAEGLVIGLATGFEEKGVNARVDLHLFLLDSSLPSALFYAHLISAGSAVPVTSPIRCP